jgi:hypothetical protein
MKLTGARHWKCLAPDLQPLQPSDQRLVLGVCAQITIVKIREMFNMEILLSDLQEIFTLLLQNIKGKGIETINLEVDYYWNIPQPQVYEPYQKPLELDLGRLSDDWNELRKILKTQREPLGYHLVWLAAILRAIGENSLF